MEKLNMGYWDIMNLWFYDFQNILQSYQNIIEMRNKEEEDQARKQGYDPSKYTPDNMMKNAKGMMPSMPKMPNMSGFKL